MNWYAIHVRSRHEQVVYTHLARSFRLFFPTLEVWRGKSGMERKAVVPLFPGYLFIHCYPELHTYVEILRTRGVVKLVEDDRNRLAVVRDEDIRSLQQVLNMGIPLHPAPYLKGGQRVRVVQGPLAGVEGIWWEEPAPALVLSIMAIQRSVAVEVDPSHVKPLPAGQPLTGEEPVVDTR